MRKTAIMIFFLVLLFPFQASYAAETAPAGIPVPREGVAVLAYHHLEPSSNGKQPANNSVLSVEEFAWQMEYLHNNNFYTMTMDEMKEYLAGRFNPPRRAVLITFDDGYESNYTLAFPILARYNFRAAIFLIGKKPGDDYSATGPAVVAGTVPNRHLTTYQIKNMLKTGLLEFGCHTYNNHRLVDGRAALTVLETDSIRDDLLHFNNTLGMVGIPVPYALAYPYGAGSNNAVEAASPMGYRLGFTVNSGYAHPGDNTMFINRFSLRPGDGRQYFTDVVNGAWKPAEKETPKE